MMYLSTVLSYITPLCIFTDKTQRERDRMRQAGQRSVQEGLPHHSVDTCYHFKVRAVSRQGHGESTPSRRNVTAASFIARVL